GVWGIEENSTRTAPHFLFPFLVCFHSLSKAPASNVILGTEVGSRLSRRGLQLDGPASLWTGRSARRFRAGRRISPRLEWEASRHFDQSNMGSRRPGFARIERTG